MALDDVESAREAAISQLLPVKPSLKIPIGPTDCRELAEALFEVLYESRPSRALEWLRQRQKDNPKQPPVDLMFVDVNFSENKYLSDAEKAAGDDASDAGLRFVEQVLQEFPTLNVIMVTAHLTDHMKRFRQLHLMERVAIKYKGGDVSGDLREHLHEYKTLQNIAFDKLKIFCRTETNRLGLIGHLDAYFNEQRQLAGSQNVGLDERLQSKRRQWMQKTFVGDRSLYHLMAGWAMADMDRQTGEVEAVFDENVISVLLGYLNSAPFRQTFDPCGTPGRLLHIFEAYLNHPKHAAWSVQLDNEAAAIVEEVNNKDPLIKKNPPRLPDEIKQQIWPVDLAKHTEIDWEGEDNPSFIRFMRFLRMRRVVLGIFKYKEDDMGFKNWDECELFEMCIRVLTRNDYNAEIAPGVLTQNFNTYLGFRGTLINQNTINRAIPNILPEEQAFWEQVGVNL